MKGDWYIFNYNTNRWDKCRDQSDENNKPHSDQAKIAATPAPAPAPGATPGANAAGTGAQQVQFGTAPAGMAAQAPNNHHLKVELNKMAAAMQKAFVTFGEQL